MPPLARFLIPAAACAGLLLAAVPARADESPTFEVTPFAGYRIGGQFDVTDPVTSATDSVDLKSGGSFGVDFGFYRDGTSFYELLYSRQATSLDSNDAALKGVDVTVEYYQVGGTLTFPEQSPHFVPYLSLTVGATRIGVDATGADTQTKFSGSLGGGVRIPFTDNLAANLGVRGYLTLIESDTDILCVSGSQGGTCLLKSSGSTFIQGEAQLGLTFRF
jgi:opacity protein-like surface antigen